MRPSDEARNAFEDWRRSQALEQEARPGSLFDAPVEPLTTDEAIESVTEHAGTEFVEHVVEIVERVARNRDRITVDDIAPLVTLAVYDRRAMGGAMRVAARRKIIARVPGQYVTSARSERHSSPVALWRSLVRERVA